MLKRQIEKHKLPEEYNHVTQYNENQDFWNKGIGRYDYGVFPFKHINQNGCYSNKDYLAIQSAEPRLVTAWKRRNYQLIQQYGTDWFNNGDPGMGTVGVFSDFYCLNQKGQKTVDDLFPDGYKT
tara:strand:- start:175 stop:546 length:372 start_codon:yes stop_codon:yes gene_type:complete